MRLRTLLAVVCAVSLPLAPPALATTTPGQGLEVQAVRSVSDRAVSLVLAVPTASARPAGVKVLAGGQELPTVVVPVLSDRTALALVLDASAEGAPALRGGGLSGAAGFLLQLPSSARTAVIADRSPPEVAAGSTVGISDALLATSSLRSAGQRATSEALTLALRELAIPADVPPVIVLYSTATSADGETAAAVAERLQAAGAILAVVTTSADDASWPGVATATGGVAVRAAPERSLEAFEAVAEGLRRRYTVTFEQPPAGTSAVTLLVEGAGGATTVEVDLSSAPSLSSAPALSATPSASPGAAPSSGGQNVDGGQAGAAPGVIVVAAGAVLLSAGLGVVLLYRRRARGRKASAAPLEPPAEPSLFEARAEVDTTDPEHQRELAAEYQRQAGSDRAGGLVALAASGYRQAIDALAQRVTLDPGNPAFQYDLAVALTGLAELDAEQGWTAQAAAGYQRAVEIGEALIQSDPGNPAYRRNLDLARTRMAALDPA